MIGSFTSVLSMNGNAIGQGMTKAPSTNGGSIVRGKQ